MNGLYLKDPNFPQTAGLRARFADRSNQKPKLEERVESVASPLLGLEKKVKSLPSSSFSLTPFRPSTSYPCPTTTRNDEKGSLFEPLLIAEGRSSSNSPLINPAECKQADAYRDNGDSVEAAKNYKLAERYRLAADAYRENGDSIEADEHYKLAAEHYSLVADAYRESGNNREAAKCYRSAADAYYKEIKYSKKPEIKYNTKHEKHYKLAAEHYSLVADAYRESGDNREAAKCYRYVLKNSWQVSFFLQMIGGLFKMPGYDVGKDPRK